MLEGREEGLGKGVGGEGEILERDERRDKVERREIRKRRRGLLNGIGGADKRLARVWTREGKGLVGGESRNGHEREKNWGGQGGKREN